MYLLVMTKLKQLILEIIYQQQEERQPMIMKQQYQQQLHYNV